VAADAAGDDGERQRRRSQPRQFAGREQQTATDLHRGVRPGESLGVGWHVRSDGVGQLAHPIERWAGGVGGGLGVTKGIHPLPDESH